MRRVKTSKTITWFIMVLMALSTAVIQGGTPMVSHAAVDGDRCASLGAEEPWYAVENTAVYCEVSSILPLKTKVKIGHACREDRWGRLGDQTGREVRLGNWFYTPGNQKHRHFTLLLRMKDPQKAEKLAYIVEQACTKDYVGYSMDEKKRVSFYRQLKAAGWDIDRMDTPCATSCTRLACAGINAAGIDFAYDIDSFDLRKEAERHKADMYIIDDPAFLTNYTKLRRGDILCDEPHHTIIVL